MNYFWLILKHKWFVFLAGIRLGCSFWRLLTHDLSKLSLTEYFHYQRQFFGAADDPEGFIQCWVHHQNHNDHHWEYWIPRTGHNRGDLPYPDNEPIPMPMSAVKEMIADWMGAGRAYNGKWPDLNDWTWLKQNRYKMVLHEETTIKIDYILDGFGKSWK